MITLGDISLWVSFPLIGGICCPAGTTKEDEVVHDIGGWEVSEVLLYRQVKHRMVERTNPHHQGR